jgi:hypothetical protein
MAELLKAFFMSRPRQVAGLTEQRFEYSLESWNHITIVSVRARFFPPGAPLRLIVQTNPGADWKFPGRFPARLLPRLEANKLSMFTERNRSDYSSRHSGYTRQTL